VSLNFSRDMSYLGVSNVSCVGFGSSVPTSQAGSSLHTQIDALRHQLAALTLHVQEQQGFAPPAQTTPLATPAQGILVISPPAEAVPGQGATAAPGAPPHDPPPASDPAYGAGHYVAPMPVKMTLSIPVPLVDPTEPFLTLRHWDSWHNQVTDAFYKNSQGTHAAISVLMRHEANTKTFASGSAQLRQFQHTVLNTLLLLTPPSYFKDEALWARFKHQFCACLEITAAKQLKTLHRAIYGTQRRLGDPLYGFSTDFYNAVLNYNSLNSVALRTPADVNLLIYALNINHTPWLELEAHLIRAQHAGATVPQVMDIIAMFPNLTVLTQTERANTTVLKAPAASPFFCHSRSGRRRGVNGLWLCARGA
jgi:hypothetical protein